MSDIAMLVAEEYERRVKNSKKSGGGGEGGGGAAAEEIGFVSSVSAIAMRLEGFSWVKKAVGEENTEIVKWVLEPKSQIGLAAINGFFSAWIFFSSPPHPLFFFSW